MSGFEEGYAGLARTIGHATITNGEGIVIQSQRGRSTSRERVAAAAMSAAMLTGDVDGVVVALRLLGVQPLRRDVRPC